MNNPSVYAHSEPQLSKAMLSLNSKAMRKRLSKKNKKQTKLQQSLSIDDCDIENQGGFDSGLVRIITSYAHDIQAEGLMDFNHNVNIPEATSIRIEQLIALMTSTLQNQEITHKVEGLDKTLPLLIDIGIASAMVYALVKRDKVVLAVAGAALIYRFSNVKEMASKVFKNFMSSVDEPVVVEDGIEAQAGFSFGKSLPIGMLGGLFLYRLLDGIHYCADLSDCVSYATSLIKSIFGSGYTGAFEVFLKFLQLAVDSAWKLFKGEEECPFSFIPRSTTRVHQLLKELTEIDVLKSTNTMELREMEGRLEDITSKLQVELAAMPKESNTHHLISSMVVKYRAMLAEVKTLNRASSGSRVEPVCYMFIGPPGCGKTMFNMTIATYFVKELSSGYMKRHYQRHPDDMYKNIFSYDQQDSYHSGYRNQLVFHFDEADPRSLVSGSVSIPAKILRLVNTLPCPLNMADLGAKGTTFFDSKIMLGSSNTYSWNQMEGVQDPESFFRRVSFILVQPNIAKLQASFKERVALKSINDFQAYRPFMQEYMEGVAEQYVTGEIGFDEYMDKAYYYVDISKCDMSTNCSNVNEAPKTPLTPSDLIKRVVLDAESKVRKHAFTSKLACRMTQDNMRFSSDAVPGRFVEAQGASSSKFSSAVKDRYFNIVSNDPVATAGYARFAGTTYDDNYIKAKQIFCRHIYSCDGHLCKSYIESESSRVFSVKALRALGGRLSQLQIEQLVTEVYNMPTSKVGARCFCRITGSDSEEIYGQILQLCVDIDEEIKKELLAKMVGVVDKVYGVMRATFDFAAVVAVVVAIRGMYRMYQGSSVKPEGDYPLRPTKDARGRRPKMITRTAEIQPQGGSDDLMTSIANNNIYRFEVRGENVPTLTAHFIMVQNKYGMTPIHVLASIIDAYEINPEAEMHIHGCLSMKRGVPSWKKQIIPLDNLIARDDNGNLAWRGGCYEVANRFRLEDGEEVHHGDLGLVYVPVNAKTITNHFFSDGFFESKDQSFERVCTLITVSSDLHVIRHHPRVSKVQDWASVCSNKEDVSIEENGEKYIDKYKHWFGTQLFRYDEKTAVGYCGSPLFIKQGGAWKVAGVHVAGSPTGGIGFSIHCTKEQVLRALERHSSDNFGTKYGVQVGAVLKEKDPIAMIADHDFIRAESNDNIFGHLTSFRVKAPTVMSKSVIIKSPIYSSFHGPDRAPAMLVKTVVDEILIDPMVCAQEGYGAVIIAPNSYAVEAIVENTWADIGRFDIHEHERQIPANWENVVSPSIHFECVKSIARNKSAGYPYSLKVKKPGKRDFFGEEQDYTYNSRSAVELFASASMIEQQILLGQRPLLLCNSFLKDERRSIEKVLAGKTRLVSGSNIMYTLLLRKYTMGFQNWTIRNKIKNHIAIGVNPYGGDWDTIAAHHGYHVGEDQGYGRTIAGDFSGYDKSLHYSWVMGLVSLMDKFYNDVGSNDQKIRFALMQEIAFSRHVVGENIVEWVGSNTSGNAMTTILNSYCNIFVIKHALVDAYLLHNGRGRNSSTFGMAVSDLFNVLTPMFKYSVFGDDNLISLMDVSPENLEWFKPKRIAEAFKKGLGIVYTDENKGHDMVQNLRNISEVTFLKRGFKKHGLFPHTKERYLSPLELDTIRDSIRWMKKSTDGDSRTDWAKNVELMLEELSLHDRFTYNSVGKEIIDATNLLDEKPSNLPIILFKQELQQLRIHDREFEY